MICSFYGLIITQERDSGIRFYLKAKNITPFVYISRNLISDTILGSTCMIIIVSGSMGLVSWSHENVFTLSDFVSGIGILCLWKISFILQHYFLGYILRDSSIVLAWGNLLIILFLFASSLGYGLMTLINNFLIQSTIFFEVSKLIFNICNPLLLLILFIEVKI